MEARDFRRNPRPGYLKKFVKLVLANYKLNMSNWIDRLAETYGERVVIYLDRPLDYGFFRGTDITYRDSLKFVNRIGNALLGLGVKPGDRVAMITTNRIEFAFCCFAVMKIGAIAVPLNAMYRSHEIRYVIENSGAKVLITDRAVYGAGIQDPAQFPSIEKWVMLTREDLPPGFFSLADLMLKAREDLPPLPLSPDDIVGIFYTSGTTGLPKGAMLSNEGFSREVKGFARISALFPGFLANRFLGVYVTPLAHIMGYVVIIAVFSGGNPSIFKTTFTPSDILQTIQENQATSFVGVPTMFRMLVAAGSDNS